MLLHARNIRSRWIAARVGEFFLLFCIVASKPRLIQTACSTTKLGGLGPRSAIVRACSGSYWPPWQQWRRCRDLTAGRRSRRSCPISSPCCYTAHLGTWDAAEQIRWSSLLFCPWYLLGGMHPRRRDYFDCSRQFLGPPSRFSFPCLTPKGIMEVFIANEVNFFVNVKMGWFLFQFDVKIK